MPEREDSEKSGWKSRIRTLFRQPEDGGTFDEKTLKEAFDSLDLGLIYFDRNDRLVMANSQAYKVVPALAVAGETEKKYCGCKKKTGKHIETLQQFISYVFDRSIEAHDQTGLFVTGNQSDTNSFREIIKQEDGSFFLVRAVPQKSKGTIVEMTDISMIKSRNDYLAQLGAQNDILMEAVQMSLTGIVIADNKTTEKKILFLNQAMSHFLGEGYKEYLEQPILSLCRKEFGEECERIEDVINGKKREHIWKSKNTEDGKTVWFEINFFPTGQDGNLLIGFVTDQTQAKMQENRLRQTQKLEAIGQLAGGVAHDFNNILAIMEGYSRMMESAWKRGEDISGNFGKLYQAVQRGSGLTRQLLTFGKHRISDDRVVNLCEQIEELKPLLMPLLGVNIELEIKNNSMPIYVRGSLDSLSQIIMNLSINARDAMPDGGKLTIETRRHLTGPNKSIVCLIVSDTGKGMTRETMERMYDPFFTTKEQGKGTGLGLSTVYGLVQQMKGDIQVDSEPGRGSVFTIWFPEEDVSSVQEELLEKNTEESKKGLDGRTVILAEDEPDLLDIMSHTLEGFGMKVLRASNGNKALEIQDDYDGEIDFLLTDMVMPELNGLELAKLFHEVRPATHIVFMSGYPVRGEISEIDIPEEAVFMAKPISHENLKKVMEQVCYGQDPKQGVGKVWG